MTRYDMTCDGFTEQLADYLEGDASELVRVGMEAHAAGCGACAALLADLVALPLDARALPALVPSRDLWSGIAERIDAPVLPMEGATRMRGVLAAQRHWSRPAIAAAALVLFTAGITNWLTRATLSGTPPIDSASGAGMAPRAARIASVAPVIVNGTEGVDTPDVNAPGPDASLAAAGRRREGGASRVAVRGGPGNGARPATVGPSRNTPRAAFAEPRGIVPARLASSAPAASADPVYDRDIAALRRIVRERRAQLDPATVAVLEQSVAVIDSAIAQSRAALARDPASRFLATQLNHSLEKKVELLRTVAMLPART